MEHTVFVTGAHNGTGYAIAERFAREGWAVLIGSRNQESADAAAEKLKTTYGVYTKGYSYQTATPDADEVRAIFEDIRANGHSVGALVLNAANLGLNQVSMELDIHDFMGVYNTNIFWNFLMAREAAKQRCS